jgi:hypothetical protein
MRGSMPVRRLAARWTLATALGLMAAAGAAAAEPGVVDMVLAEVDRSAVALSDVALARALGVLGLEPSAGPITEADLTRWLDGQLVLREAAQLAIQVPAADVERAWEAAGGDALAARLRAAGVEPAWGRRLVEAGLRARRFVELRFEAFAFVTDFDVDDALGPGPHDAAARQRTRERLRQEMVTRAFEAWREDARRRFSIHRVPGVAGPWPAPFTLGPIP